MKSTVSDPSENIFDQFTGKYALSKTLKFELKPVGKTQQLLLENKVFQKDQTIDNSYKQAKYYFDKLHQEFIEEALDPQKTKEIDFAGFAKFLAKANAEIRRLKQSVNRGQGEGFDAESAQAAIRKCENDIKEYRTSFLKEIVKCLDGQAEAWKVRYLEEGVLSEEILKKENAKGTGFLTSAGVLSILKKRFPKENNAEFLQEGMPSLFVEELENPGETRYIFDSFDKFSGYLTKFQETRKNIYSDKGIASALATRIVSNFELFLANKHAFDTKYQDNYQIVGITDTSIFGIENYHCYLRQNAIEVFENKDSVSEVSYNKIIGSINKNIKEYRDKLANEARLKGVKFQKSDYPLFKKLEKQILGALEKEGQLIETTHSETEEEVFIRRFKEFIGINESRFSAAQDIMQRFFGDEFEKEYNGIFLKNSSINTIARRWFADAYTFEALLPQASNKAKDESDTVKVKAFVTLDDVRNAVEKLPANLFKESYYKQGAVNYEQSNWEQFLSVWRYEFDMLFTGLKREDGTTDKTYDAYLSEAHSLEVFAKERKKEQVAKVKNYADASLRVYQFMKYLALEERDLGAQANISVDFYAELDAYAKDFEFIRYYNAFRNFVTRKNYESNKIKLNFEKGNLLGGWAESPEGNAQFCSYILRKQEKYYLGIADSSTILDFQKQDAATPQDDFIYEKMIYRQLKATQIYGSVYSGKYGTKYSADKLKLNDQELIDRVKLLLRRYVGVFPELEVVINGAYESAKSLAAVISELTLYGLEFKAVSGAYVESIVHDIRGKNKHLYLFEIKNKDFSEASKGNSNIHTLYFKQLFSEANLQSPVFKLSGGAEIFYRQKSKELPTKVDNNKKEVVAHKRFAEDKMQFHLPIVMNAKEGKARKFNLDINQALAGKSDVNVIGLDRGEKHLVYYSVVNQKGEILDQGSLNTINGQDYYSKLVEREKERLKNRQSWDTVAAIKDLKKGYVSLVVRKIADLAVKHNAIIVMEDLNTRFKQVRGGIERSVYQQLEKQLIDKFGYLVFKDRKPEEVGGVLNGYQLAAPFETFEKMGKQTGVIFYTQAEYTSVTDPLSGFRKNIYISNSASQTKIKNELAKFDAIGWDDTEQSYFFTYDPTNFVEEKYRRGTYSKEWTIYAKAPRIRREKDENGYWRQTPINLNEKFRELFEVWNFERLDAEDLKEDIMRKISDNELEGKRVSDGKERDFYHAFIYLFNLVLQLRNSFSEQWLSYEKEDGTIGLQPTGENIDFIASPVKPFFSTLACNKQGVELSSQHFDSFNGLIIGEEADRIRREFNGDANGAYNIARKGTILLDRISKNPTKPDMYITKAQWDEHIDRHL